MVRRLPDAHDRRQECKLTGSVCLRRVMYDSRWTFMNLTSLEEQVTKMRSYKNLLLWCELCFSRSETTALIDGVNRDAQTPPTSRMARRTRSTRPPWPGTSSTRLTAITLSRSFSIVRVLPREHSRLWN